MFIVGCSGGVDSMVLLDSLASEPALNARIAGAVHVVHNLRSQEEGDRERQLLIDYCGRRRIPFYVQTLPPLAIASLGWHRKISEEHAARELRYAAIERLVLYRRGNSMVLTAHHETDQQETHELYKRRGRGAGYPGIPCFDPDSRRFRPLLSLSKDDILHYARTKKLSWSEDSSNASLRYERNRIRHGIPWPTENTGQALELVSDPVPWPSNFPLVLSGPSGDQTRYYASSSREFRNCLKAVLRASATGDLQPRAFLRSLGQSRVSIPSLGFFMANPRGQWGPFDYQFSHGPMELQLRIRLVKIQEQGYF